MPPGLLFFSLAPHTLAHIHALSLCLTHTQLQVPEELGVYVARSTHRANFDDVAMFLDGGKGGL